MIKEQLKKALSAAVEEYNGGASANEAIAKTASAYDFNGDQTDRLCELFNTAAALNQEKSASDPTGSCELANKEEVARLLVTDNKLSKAASVQSGVNASDIYNGFYATVPECSNPMRDARRNGADALIKAAGSNMATQPQELDVSQRSIYKMICDNINLLKSAGAAADDVARQMRLESDRLAIKIAKTIESPSADQDLADMFKAACECKNAVGLVAEYSTKVAESAGGRFAGMAVFDAGGVSDLLKAAEELENILGQVTVYENKREHYMSKAAEAEDEVRSVLGLEAQEKIASVADLFQQSNAKHTAHVNHVQPVGAAEDATAKAAVKVAELLRMSGAESADVERLAAEFEKDAAGGNGAIPRVIVSGSDILNVMAGRNNSPGWTQKVLNEYRRMLLDDLLSNDPIIRDADPNAVAEIYKSIVMSAPRLSLDPTAVRSVLRSGVNSVAISPNDLKTLTDVDKGVSIANIAQLSNLDSSIKDSNMA